MRSNVSMLCLDAGNASFFSFWPPQHHDVLLRTHIGQTEYLSVDSHRKELSAYDKS